MTRCQRCFGELSEFAVFCPTCAQVHEPDLSQLLNHTVGGRYKLYRQLGQGGLSTVFAATDLQTDSVVVVKVSDPAQLVRRELVYSIDAEAARNYWREMLERMRHEAEALTGIEHPNIVRLFDSGMIGDDLRFVAMEFLRGRTLREELDARGKLEIGEAVTITLQLCDALSEVHAREIVHRDVNPRNVMLSDDGGTKRQREGGRERFDNREFASAPQSLNPSIPQSLYPPVVKAKLIDFGIAKFPQPPGAPPFTQHSVLSGTVAYASPEQCQSRAVDHRSDIYSLGVMLYELLTGERPFKGRTPTEIAIHHLQAAPQPPRQLNPEIPLNLEKVVLRALAKLPEDRQQSVQELADQLQANARQVIIPLMPEMSADAESSDAVAESDPATVERLVLVRRRRRRVAVAAVTILLVVLAGAMFGRQWLASRALPMLASAFPGASPTPEELIASDADSLELAAQLSGDPLAGGATKDVPAVSANQSVQPSGTASSTVTSGKTNSTDSARPSGEITPAPTPLAAKTSPSNSQPATPPVMAAKPPQTPNPPVNSSESASTRQKTDERKIRQREQDSSANTSTNTSNGTVAREDASTAKRDRIANDRTRDEEPQRRQPEDRRESQETVSDDEVQDAGYDSQQIGPKLIQWSGRIRGEREVTIDLPGTPGTLEIPRVYRNRVAMIEPPSASNRWRLARLRVFGDGGVSFVVRWWPNSSSVSRIAGR